MHACNLTHANSGSSYSHAGHEGSIGAAPGQPDENSSVESRPQGQLMLAPPATTAVVAAQQHAGGRGEETSEEAERGDDPGNVSLGVTGEHDPVPVRLEQADAAQEAVRRRREREAAQGYLPELDTLVERLCP